MGLVAQVGLEGEHLLSHAGREVVVAEPTMRAASSPALRAPPIDTVATGTPAGTWTIESRESIPSRNFSGTRIPMTGSGVTDASMPGRWAAPRPPR